MKSTTPYMIYVYLNTLGDSLYNGYSTLNSAMNDVRNAVSDGKFGNDDMTIYFVDDNFKILAKLLVRCGYMAEEY